MAAMYPGPEETEDTREGDAIHEIGAEGIAAACRGFPMARPDKASNGVVVTDELYDAALVYRDYCLGICRDNGIFGGAMLRIEEKVRAPQVHELSEGTPDFVVFNRDAGRLHIVDCKGGRRLVEVFENWQLINYYAGIVNEYEIDGYVDQDLDVVFGIVQPRGFHREGPIREWVVKASDLRAHINQLRHAASECFEPEPLLRSGPHCRDCPARLHCPVATAAGLSIYESAMTMQTQNMTPAQIGLQLMVVDRAYEELKSLREALETEVESLTRQGKPVAHWRTEPAYGRLTWANDDAQIIAIGDQLGVDLRSGKACTPTQARDRNLLDPAVIDQLSTKPRKGWTVVPDNDSKTTRIFS